MGRSETGVALASVTCYAEGTHSERYYDCPAKSEGEDASGRGSNAKHSLTIHTRLATAADV
eukprot:8859114-Pyramimonas_sp.AAC.3